MENQGSQNLQAVLSVSCLVTALPHWGCTGAVPLHRTDSIGLSHTGGFSTRYPTYPIAMSWRNDRGWMLAAEDRVCRADADNLPTGEREAKWQNFWGVLSSSSPPLQPRKVLSDRFYPLARGFTLWKLPYFVNLPSTWWWRRLFMCFWSERCTVRRYFFTCLLLLT